MTSAALSPEALPRLARRHLQRRWLEAEPGVSDALPSELKARAAGQLDKAQGEDFAELLGAPLEAALGGRAEVGEALCALLAELEPEAGWRWSSAGLTVEPPRIEEGVAGEESPVEVSAPAEAAPAEAPAAPRIAVTPVEPAPRRVLKARIISTSGATPAAPLKARIVQAPTPRGPTPRAPTSRAPTSRGPSPRAPVRVDDPIGPMVADAGPAEEAARERRDISWGLVLGALLLVGGAIPLAIQLLRHGQDWLKLTGFGAASLALLGIAWACLTKLQVKQTGRVLAGAFLFLAPLNVLAGAALEVSPILTGGVGILLGLCAAFAAGLLRLDRGWLTAGLVGLSLLHLGPRLAPELGGPALILAGLIFAAAGLWATRPGERLSRERTGPFISGLAALAFAHILVSARLLAVARPGLAALAVELLLTALPPLLLGTRMRGGQAPGASEAEDFGATGRAWGALILAGAWLLISAALLLSFQVPALLLGEAVLLGLVGAALYARSGQGGALALTLLAATLASLAASALQRGAPDLRPRELWWLMDELPLALALVLAGGALRRGGRVDHGRALILLGGLAGASILLIAGLSGPWLIAFAAAGLVSALLGGEAAAGFIAAGFTTWIGVRYGLPELPESWRAPALVFAGAALLSQLVALTRLLPGRLGAALAPLAPGYGTVAWLASAVAVLLSPWRGEGQGMILACLLAALSQGLGWARRRDALTAIPMTIALLGACAGLPVLSQASTQLLRDPEQLWVMSAGAALLGVLAALVNRRGLTRPVGATAWLAAQLAIAPIVMGDDAYAGLALALAAAASLALAARLRSRLLSGIAAFELAGAGVHLILTGPLESSPWALLAILGLAAALCELPVWLERLLGSGFEPHRGPWRLAGLVLALALSPALLRDPGELPAMALAAGLAALHARQIWHGGGRAFAALFALHGLAAVAEAVFGLPWEPAAKQGALAASLPAALLLMTLPLRGEASEEGPERTLSEGLTWTTRLLGPALLLALASIYILAPRSRELRLGAALGSALLGLQLGLLSWRSAREQLVGSYAALSLAGGWALTLAVPSRWQALALGAAGLAALIQGGRRLLPLDERLRERGWVELWEALLFAVLPVAGAAALIGPGTWLSPLALALLGFAGLAGSGLGLMGLGAVAASLAVARGLPLAVAMPQEGVGAALAWAAAPGALAVLAAPLGRLLRGGADGAAREQVLRGAALCHATLALIGYAAAVVLAWSGAAAPQGVALALGFVLPLALAGLFAVEAQRRESEAMVYLGEVALLLLLGFLRGVRPEWFESGWLKQGWPFIVMGLAYASLGLASLLRGRDGAEVFGRAFGRTAMVLPLLPVLGGWEAGGGHALSLGMAALLYGLRGRSEAQRGAGGLTLLAAALGASAAMRGLAATGFAAGDWPTLFALPIGLAMQYVGARVREEQPEVAARLRELGAVIVFGALSWELLADDRRRLLESFLLAVGGVAGVILGMRLRSRPMMVLGTVFVALDLLANVYWISEGRAWIWWLALMALGLAVIVLFSLSERRRAVESGESGEEE